MKSGFTLVEMAMVLLILGLLTSSFIVPLGAQIDSNHLKATDQQLSRIKEALLGYAIRNRQLPCPSSTTTGTQDSTLCAQEGFLPWADLGVEGRDAWGNYFRYRADSKHTANGAYNTTFPTATDALQVVNKAATTTYVTNAVAIFYSLGKNKTADAGNATQDQTYSYDDFIPNSFDDRLMWISDAELVSRLAAAGFRIK